MPAVTDKPEPITLTPGKTTDREINGIQKHRYRIELAAGQTAVVTSKETSVDIGLQLLDSNGKVLAGVDAQNAPDASDNVTR